MIAFAAAAISGPYKLFTKDYNFFKRYIYFLLQRALDSPGNLFVDMKIFNPLFVTNQKAIVEWTEYYHNIEQRISTSTESYFDDDFSTACVGKLSLTVIFFSLGTKSDIQIFIHSGKIGSKIWNSNIRPSKIF